MRRIALLFTLLLAAFAPPLHAKTFRIAVIPRETSGIYWDEIHAGMLAAKKDLLKQQTGVEIIWLPPGGTGAAADQIAMVQKVAAARFDALILAPVDAEQLLPVVEATIRGGLPVMIIDNLLSSPLTISYIGTNNYEAGQIAGGFLGKQIGERGSVLVVGDPDTSANIRQRAKGFIDGSRIFPNVFVLSSGDYADTIPVARPAVAGAMMKKFASRLNGVFTSDGSLLPVSLQALQDAGLNDSRICHVVFGSSPDLVEQLRAGKIQALIADDPFGIGVQSLRSTIDSLEGKRIAPRISIATAIVTADHIDDADNMMSLHPPVGDYLKDGKEIPQDAAAIPVPTPAATAPAAPTAPEAKDPAPDTKQSSPVPG